MGVDPLHSCAAVPHVTGRSPGVGGDQGGEAPP